MKNKKEFSAYRRIFEHELQANILEYWLKNAPEKDGDGFYGAVDLNNQPVLHANKACVLNARILWTFSAAAMAYLSSIYAETADRAYYVMQTHFADHQYGGFFMEISPTNQPANDIKHTYAQAFALYALSKYYEFCTQPDLLRQIQELFVLLEEKTKDPAHPGYRESFTRDWQLISENRMADHNEPKSMNTHLHVLEAYAALYKIWPDARVGERLRELLLIFMDKIIRPDGHLGIFFDEAFNEAESSRGTCSFGHDIEASWLLWEAAEILGAPELLDRLKPISLKMLDAVERVGFDKDGGLFLESTRYGSHVRTNKHWWLQAETLVGFMNGFELSGNPHYWENVKQSWDFIDRYVIDHLNGEWFTKVNRLGEPFRVEPPDDPSPYYRNDWKIDPWKCPYHNGRACLEMIRRIDAVIERQS